MGIIMESRVANRAHASYASKTSAGVPEPRYADFGLGVGDDRYPQPLRSSRCATRKSRTMLIRAPIAHLRPRSWNRKGKGRCG